MDLGNVTAVARPANVRDFTGFTAGDAWLAGGTWLFSEPQPRLTRLIDLSRTGWQPLTSDASGLTIAATCTIAQLDAFEAPAAWVGGSLIGLCCRAFLASFKIWNMATVGGNLCMSLPAGPMISLCAALEGVCTIWTPDGGERQLPVVDFVRGPIDNALQPGEILRAVTLPAETLSRRTAFRRASLSVHGRSGVLLIGTRSTAGGFVLTVTASTRRPVQFKFSDMPSRTALRDRIAHEISHGLYYDDVHGHPDWRRHMTFEFADEIRRELSEVRA